MTTSSANIFDVHGVHREDGEKITMTILYLVKDSGEISMSAPNFGAVSIPSSDGISHDLDTFASAFDIVLNHVQLRLY